MLHSPGIGKTGILWPTLLVDVGNLTDLHVNAS